MSPNSNFLRFSFSRKHISYLLQRLGERVVDGLTSMWAVSQGIKCSLHTTFIKPFDFAFPTTFSFRGPLRDFWRSETRFLLPSICRYWPFSCLHFVLPSTNILVTVLKISYSPSFLSQESFYCFNIILVGIW